MKFTGAREDGLNARGAPDQLPGEVDELDRRTHGDVVGALTAPALAVRRADRAVEHSDERVLVIPSRGR